MLRQLLRLLRLRFLIELALRVFIVGVRGRSIVVCDGRAGQAFVDSGGRNRTAKIQQIAALGAQDNCMMGLFDN